MSLIVLEEKPITIPISLHGFANLSTGEKIMLTGSRVFYGDGKQIKLKDDTKTLDQMIYHQTYVRVTLPNICAALGFDNIDTLEINGVTFPDGVHKKTPPAPYTHTMFQWAATLVAVPDPKRKVVFKKPYKYFYKWSSKEQQSLERMENPVVAADPNKSYSQPVMFPIATLKTSPNYDLFAIGFDHITGYGRFFNDEPHDEFL